MEQTQNVESAVTLDDAVPCGTVIPNTTVPCDEKLCAVTVECEVAADMDMRGRLNGKPFTLSSRFAGMRRSAYWIGLLVGIAISALVPRVIQWMGGTYSVGAETIAVVEGEREVVSETSVETAVGTSSASGSAPVSIRPPARNAAATALEYAKTVDVQPNVGSGAVGSGVAARRSGNVSAAVRTDAAGGVGMEGNVFQIQPVPANTDMIAVSTQLQNPETRESYQQLTLIDTKKKVITVYHIDAALGQVSLQCVRPFRYDQELQSYYHKDYTGNPLMPSEIQQMLEEQN